MTGTTAAHRTLRLPAPHRRPPAALRLLALLTLILTAAFPASARQKTQDRNDKAIDPTHYGRVTGQVYDALTGEPIEGAAVSVARDAEFPEKGREAGKTDKRGLYRVEAMLGRVSSNIDVGRAIENMLVPFSFGSAKNVTKRIDVSRLTVRITCEGYHPYEGVVMCRALIPKDFAVILEPVLLTPASSAEVSTMAENWGVVRITDVLINPPLLRPDTQAALTVRVQCPRLVRNSDLKVRCLSRLWGNAELKLQADSPEGFAVFTGRFHVPRMTVGVVQPLVATITQCPYDIAVAGASRTALLQVVATPDEERAATTRAAAYQNLVAGQPAQAIAPLKTLCAAPQPVRLDLQQLGATAMTVKDYASAVDARSRLVDLAAKSPEAERLAALTLFAESLLANGEPDRVISIVNPVVQAVKEKDRMRHIPPQLMVTLGAAYLQNKDLAQAETIRQQLVSWNITSLVPGMARFENGLRLAQARAHLDAAPASAAAHAEYGRVLLDQERWEEGIQELRAAQSADPNLPAVERDLTYALLAVNGGEQQARKSLPQAIAEARSQTVVTQNNKPIKSKDFFAWYTLSMLLYAQTRQLQSAADPAAETARLGCQDAMIEALKCGRTGANVNSGRYSPLFGYTSDRVVSIAGFAYPQANGLFLIRESLKALHTNPSDVYSLFDLGTALIDLGYADLAREPIDRVLQLRPDFTEARYAAALIDLQQGHREAAIRQITDVLRANPRHPGANLRLARIYTEDGDMTSAAACLAAHAKYFGAQDVEVSE